MLLTLIISLGMASFQGILGLFALDKFGFSTQADGCDLDDCGSGDDRGPGCA